MKNRLLLAASLLLATSFTLTMAQQTTTCIVKLRGTRLTYSLVNRWISEFNKEFPTIKVSIAPSAPADSIDFSIASYALAPADLKENQQSLVVTNYVQLPVVNSNRPGLLKLQARGVKQKDLQDLFFSSTAPSFLASSAEKPALALYVRDRPVCAVKAFATHYGNDPSKINGTGIKGDDQDLAEAVKNDVNGISFNNLGFIYDVKTRKISKGLAIIPLDLNENGKIDSDEKIYETLDNVIQVVEKTKNPAFVNERVNFIFNKNSSNASAATFLNWVLTKGQQFNHDLGFINLETKSLNEQKDIFKSSFKISSASSCEGLDKLSLKEEQKNQQ